MSEALIYNSITQLGFVVNDINKSARVWADFLNVDLPEIMITDPVEKVHTEYKGKPTAAQAKLAFIQLDNITIELIEPIGDDSTWKECLDERGEGIHHIAFHVDGMDKNIAFLRERSGRLVQCGDFTGGRYAYFDMRQIGTIVELLSTDQQYKKEFKKNGGKRTCERI